MAIRPEEIDKNIRGVEETGSDAKFRFFDESGDKIPAKRASAEEIAKALEEAKNSEGISPEISKNAQETLTNTDTSGTLSPETIQMLQSLGIEGMDKIDADKAVPAILNSEEFDPYTASEVANNKLFDQEDEQTII